MSEAASTEQIERIVREVVRRLNGASELPSANVQSTDAVDGKTLVLNDAVVTLASVRKRALSVTRVIVQPHAVVTPAVAEELRWKGIELTRSEVPLATKTPVLLLETDGQSSLAQTKAVLARYGYRVESRREPDAPRAVETARAFVQNGGVAIVVGRKPYGLALELNRHEPVRAATVAFGVDAARAIDETLANCATVERSAAGSGQLVAMVKRMCGKKE